MSWDIRDWDLSDEGTVIRLKQHLLKHSPMTVGDIVEVVQELNSHVVAGTLALMVLNQEAVATVTDGEVMYRVVTDE